MKKLAVGLAIVLLVAGAGLVVYVSPLSRAAVAPDAQPVAGRGPARILLNEILFQPGSNQAPWVEIVNAGGATGTFDGIVLENQDNTAFSVADRLTLAAGAVTVVQLPATFLKSSGAIRLRNAQGQLDRVAWGDGQSGAANLSRGGFDEGLAAGSTLGRAPGSTSTDPLEWISYTPDQSTMGEPNQQPGVEIMMPMDGAIVNAATVDLSWYTVPATARYRVQIAADPSFASPLLDRTVEAPPLTAPALKPGSYVWRVQAIGANGSAAGYSTPNALVVPQAAPPNIDEQLPTVLDVPLIQQHKDTAMLLLETQRDAAGNFGHAWDQDHGELAWWDAADNMNCAPASLAMLVQYYKNRFNYQGRLSQDRINYEMFHAESAGPEGDLSWGRSYNRERLSRAMAFAFGVPPQIDPQDDADEVMTQAVWGTRMKAGMPAIACKNRHCVVISGFGGSPPQLVINDPGSRGTYLVPMRALRGATVFVMARPNGDRPSMDPMLVRPRSDEPEISSDYDGDGVVDFDETNRFHTNPKLKDTDQDELPDKQDILASVHDRRYGYAYGGNGRDFDGDGKAMELDADADGGGCLDGWEDENKNGKFDPGPTERDNFAKEDDGCISASQKFFEDSFWTSPGGDTQKQDNFYTIEYSLREASGSHRGQAIVTAHYKQAVTRPFPGECQNWVGETEPFQYVVAVNTPTLMQMPDGTVAVSINPPPGWHPPMMRVVFTCANSPPVETSGPAVGVAGFVRNGVFDEHVDMPLDLDGATGRKWYETHIRIGSGRR